MNLPNRLAKKLLALADNYGNETPGGTYIDLKLSQGELGEMVGTSRESINKQLRAWRAEGIVRSEKGYITLRDLDALEKLAGFTL
jgi:CRP-like cAMP-binding protein